MPTDIEIAQAARLRPMLELTQSLLGIDNSHVEPYGHYKAKLALDYIESLRERPDGKLILVTAISPTPAGEGKTTTSIGLTDALNHIGKRTLLCLRQPSVGPVFGVKGGAAGGGRAQVVPMEDINLNFTGDFSAVAAAHNLLAAMIDNHIHQGNELALDTARITWRRVVDMNDRALRHIVVGLGGAANGQVREDGFDIVAASEVMAILCLAESAADLRERLGDIVVGYARDGRRVTARELKAHGAMAVLLREALKPNLAQTLENNPVFIHGGPFGNIAHGCNSVIATRTALKLADYVVTEAGFGADLGAEKFVDIKCRKSGLRPAAAVIVATIRALKFHGGLDVKVCGSENLAALERGLANLVRHIHNVRDNYGLPCVVAINAFTADTPAEIELLKSALAALKVPVALSTHWAHGGAGAEDLAHAVVRMLDHEVSNFRFVYEDEDTIDEKLRKLATHIYGASDVTCANKVKAQIAELEAAGLGHLPLCVAKTQYSFSTNPTLRGAPSGHTLNVRELRLAAGAGFIVMIAGEVMTMPGLPKRPAAELIDIGADGRIVGLS